MATPDLCDYCSQIDFEFLRNPTVQDLRDLNQGQERSGRMPFTTDDSEQLYPRYRLGLGSRIVKESSCTLCKMVLQVLKQAGLWREPLWLKYDDPVIDAFIAPCGRFSSPLGTNWTSRGVRSLHEPVAAVDDDYFYFRRMGLTLRLKDENELVGPGQVTDLKGASTILAECIQPCDRNPPSIQVESLFEDERLPYDAVAFGGRHRPPMIDSRLPARWLKECISAHGSACSPLLAKVRSSQSWY
jgi:hypothetical protein